MIASLITVLASQLPAQTFMILDDFNGSDGAGPDGLLLSGNTLYGAQGQICSRSTPRAWVLGSFIPLPRLRRGSTLSGNILYMGQRLERLTGAVYQVNTDSTGFTFA